jgi:hypothetical protein
VFVCVFVSGKFKNFKFGLGLRPTFFRINFTRLHGLKESWKRKEQRVRRMVRLFHFYSSFVSVAANLKSNALHFSSSNFFHS